MPRRRTSAKKQRTKKIEKPRPKRERAQPTESNPSRISKNSGQSNSEIFAIVCAAVQGRSAHFRSIG